MFEPHVFDEKAQGQDALVAALLSRDMKAFEEALADPDVDPNYWYGKPYWSTCLQLAARSEGCEAFVLALLRAGAGDLRSRRPRPSDAAPRLAKLMAGADGDTVPALPPLNGELRDYLSLLLAAPAGACVCGAQAATAAAAAAVARDAAAATTTAEPGPDPRADPGAEPGAEPAGRGGGGGGGGGELKPEHVLGLWLREMSRALRDTAEHMRRELRGVAERVEQLTERVAAVERAQQRTNDILLHAAER